MAPMIIWKNAPKIFIREDAVDTFLDLVENGRVKNTNVDEEKV